MTNEPRSPVNDGKSGPYDMLWAMMEYEDGCLDEDGTIRLFQHLVDNGMAWTMQGAVGRMATHLINEGVVTRK